MTPGEPGLDRHDWESQLAGLDDALRDEPAAALPELADLVERILTESGYDVADPVASSGDERDVVSEYVAAREIADLVEAGGDAVGPGDVAAAVTGLRGVADYLVGVRDAG